MTIRQHGGVFGRNPEFNDVEANSLDLATSLEVGTFQDANTFITRDAVGTVHGATSIAPSTTEKGIFDIAADNGNIAQNRGASLTFSNNTGLFQPGYTRVGGAITVEYSTALNLQRTHDMYLWASTASTLTKQLKINNNGNIEALRGNFVVPSGNGIDFSATAGTGTSELFDDYEEGTWTPTFSAEFTAAPTVISAQYTKIGRQVAVTILATGGVVTAGGSISGLPFTSNSTQGAGAYGGNSDTTESLQGTVGQSASSITNIPARTLTGDTWQITATYFT